MMNVMNIGPLVSYSDYEIFCSFVSGEGFFNMSFITHYPSTAILYRVARLGLAAREPGPGIRAATLPA